MIWRRGWVKKETALHTQNRNHIVTILKYEFLSDKCNIALVIGICTLNQIEGHEISHKLLLSTERMWCPEMDKRMSQIL